MNYQSSTYFDPTLYAFGTILFAFLCWLLFLLFGVALLSPGILNDNHIYSLTRLSTVRILAPRRRNRCSEEQYAFGEQTTIMPDARADKVIYRGRFAPVKTICHLTILQNQLKSSDHVGNERLHEVSGCKDKDT